MGGLIVYWSATAVQLMIALAFAFATFRLFRGPRAQDRILALDTLYNLGMLMAIALGVKTGSTMYFPIALIIAVAGFLSSVALAKFLMRGEVIE